MKFCLSSRQTPEYLKQADEIRVKFQDYNQIYDLLDEYPNATMILNCQSFENEKFLKALRDFVKFAPERVILALFSLDDLEIADTFQLKRYLIHPVQTLEQLTTLKNLGMCYALLDNEVMHQLHQAKRIGIGLRAIPNISHLDNLRRPTGIYGNWIRPENIDAYGIYIDAIEFGTQKITREQGLFKIYKKDKEWIGELANIVQDLNFTTMNATIPDTACLTRMNCGMRCKAGAKCDVCYDIVGLAKPEYIHARLAEDT